VIPPPQPGTGPTQRSARRQSTDSASVNSLPSSVQRRIERILHLVSAVRKIDNDAVDLRKERRSAIRARERAKREEGPLAYGVSQGQDEMLQRRRSALYAVPDGWQALRLPRPACEREACRPDVSAPERRIWRGGVRLRRGERRVVLLIA
jgi:hypothetical protein